MLNDAHVHRYARQIILPQVGGAGQTKLKKARVLCVGAGGLGSPVALYLAAAGVGTLGIADNESVELSNLHRQILHFTTDIGRPKVSSAKQKLTALNPEVTVNSHRLRLSEKEVEDLLEGYDLVIDGSDNFPTRYLMNDACVKKNIPFISGAVVRWEGLVLSVVPRTSACYRCVFPEAPEPGSVQNCSESGILGPAAGVIGSVLATEALKQILGLGGLLRNRLPSVDFLAMRFREIPVKRDPECESCAKGKFPALSAFSGAPEENCAEILK